MPSSTQNVPLVRVYDYLQQPAGPSGGNAKPLAGVTVTLTPIANAQSLAPVVQLPAQPLQSSVTDGNGYWEIWVVPTDNQTPSGMQFLVDDGFRTYKINPTLAGIPGIGWASSAITTTQPAVLQPAQTSVASLAVANLTPGQVVFPAAAGLLTGDANFFWDNVNKRLGLGTNVPGLPLQVVGQIAATGAAPAMRLGAADGSQGQWTVAAGLTYFDFLGTPLFFRAISAGTTTVMSISQAGALTVGGGTGTLLAGFWDARAAASPAVLGGTVDWGVVNNANAVYNLRVTDAGYLVMRFGVTVGTGSVAATIGPAGIGQITAGTLALIAASTEVVQINTGTGISFPTDNTYDIGTSVSQRPRGLWLGTFIGIQGDRGAGVAGSLVLTNTTGIGNGANTNMQSPVVGTGGGPANAVLVTKWLKIWDGVTARWIPAFT